MGSTVPQSRKGNTLFTLMTFTLVKLEQVTLEQHKNRGQQGYTIKRVAMMVVALAVVVSVSSGQSLERSRVTWRR
jgi:hypothetical protein